MNLILMSKLNLNTDGENLTNKNTIEYVNSIIKSVSQNSNNEIINLIFKDIERMDNW